MHQYAYATEDYRSVSWWNTLFQWFKCHSIAEGYWYYTYVDPSKGYVDVGRTPLSNGSDGQKGLGSSAKQAELDNKRVDYADAIANIDYVVFANGDDGGIYDVKYGMVDLIEYINPNVARIHFTIDALLTYQKYIELGRCFIDRDMEFKEWDNHSSTGTYKPLREHINTMPEPVAASESDYVMQHIIGGDENEEALKYLDLGVYSQAFVATDVDLFQIEGSPYNSALPKFKPVASSKAGKADLGIGVYQVNNRVNDKFEKLGQYNAFDHILMSYSVPENLLRNLLTDDLVYMGDDWIALKDDYNDKKQVILRLPNHFSDDKEIKLAGSANDYKPLNYKCYQAPLSYFSITDKQGSSIEIVPNLIKPNLPASENYFFDLNIGIKASVMPNIASYLYIANKISGIGSKEMPFQTLWQVPTYCMTPNNSGAGLTYAQTVNAGNAALLGVAVTGLLAGGLAAATIATGGTAAFAAAAKGGSALLGKAALSTGKAALGAFTGAAATEIAGERKASLMNEIGLPKAIGGTPTGMTSFVLNSAGYEIYSCHLRTDLMKLADYMFSIIGYAQNCFRRPHVNTRKRWCYVKLQTVNLVNIGGNNYTQGGTPFWARQQIETRLKNGITFWNLRHALGDNVIGSYTGIPTSSINCRFIKNYGGSVDAPYMRDNTDMCDGYASDYDEEKV